MTTQVGSYYFYCLHEVYKAVSLDMTKQVNETQISTYIKCHPNEIY